MAFFPPFILPSVSFPYSAFELLAWISQAIRLLVASANVIFNPQVGISTMRQGRDKTPTVFKLYIYIPLADLAATSKKKTPLNSLRISRINPAFALPTAERATHEYTSQAVRTCLIWYRAQGFQL